EGDDPAIVHQAFARTLDRCYAEIRAIQSDAHQNGVSERPHWPAIVLRTPKGWTGPKVVNGQPVEGTFRAHQVPLPNARADAVQFAQLDEWMRSYQPDAVFDQDAQLVPELAGLAPTGPRRMSANPHANGGKLLVDLDIPDFRDYAIAVERPAS